MPRPSSGRLRERAVLAGGLAAAAALAGAALVARGDPELFGAATVARAAGEVADGLVAEWTRLARDGALLDGPARERFKWTAPPVPLAPRRELADLRAADPSESQAFDLLFAEARRRELAGDVGAARGLVADALARPHGGRGSARDVEAWTAALRLAARDGDGDAAWGAWTALHERVDGLVARDGVSVLLLGALAALPAWDDAPERAAAVRGAVADLWAADALALPGDVAGAEAGAARRPADAAAVLAGLDPTRAALRRELERLGTEPGPLRAADERQRARDLLALLGAQERLAAELAGTGVEIIDLGAHVVVRERAAPGRIDVDADPSSRVRSADGESNAPASPAGALDAAPRPGHGAAAGESGGEQRAGVASRQGGAVTGEEREAEPSFATAVGAGREGEAAPTAAGPDGATTRARLVARRDLEELLLAAAREELPAGFRVAFDRAPSPGGEPVRARTTLAGGVLGFTLHHDDPAALARGESGRLAALQVGLFVTAALIAGLSAFTWRALVRERRLGDLRAAFVASVSHELRTPLASILLMAENLEGGRVPADARGRYHRLIRREALRLRRLVDDVLDVSRLERGEPPRLSAEDLDVAGFVGALEVEARERVEADGGRLDFRGADLPDTLYADGEALRRAVLNLVDNAMKHSGARAIELDVRGVDGELVLAVHDRGRGVPPALRDEVFAPFARLDVERADLAPGAGLGLAIVREIARAHGGTATVRARDDGPGAVFEVRVPADGAGGAR
jgi:signal transduction histidine kinase